MTPIRWLCAASLFSVIATSCRQFIFLSLSLSLSLLRTQYIVFVQKTADPAIVTTFDLNRFYNNAKQFIFVSSIQLQLSGKQ